ncbi:hypothetical protein VPHD518_0082 [Vibrio phage D518]
MSTIIPAVELQFNKNKAVLVEAGYELADFAGMTLAKFREILNPLKEIEDTPMHSAPQGVTTTENGAQVEMTAVMGIDVEKRTYPAKEGRPRKVYQNAKAFEGAAYANIYMPMGDKNLKIGAINLQDFSENDAADNGTRRGRAVLLRLLKEHGLEKCESIKFEIELNVAALADDNHEAFDESIEAYFS